MLSRVIDYCHTAGLSDENNIVNMTWLMIHLEGRMLVKTMS